MKKILSSLKDNYVYVVAGLVYGLADGILEISNNWVEFFLYAVPYIFLIFLLELLYKKFVKK